MKSTLLISALVLGGLLVALSWLNASELPLSMSCQEFVDEGPGDSDYVSLSDFEVCKVSFAKQCTIRKEDTDNILIPAFPRVQLPQDSGHEAIVPEDVQLFVKSDTLKGDEELNSLLASNQLNGKLIKGADGLGDQEKQNLKKNYPEIDFGKVWVVDHGQSPGSGSVVYVMMGGGILLMLFGFSTIFFGGKLED